MAIGCVLLGAGQSRRMGRPKQWMTVGGVPLLEIALQNYSGLNPLAVVVDPRMRLEIDPRAGVAIDPVMGVED